MTSLPPPSAQHALAALPAVALLEALQGLGGVGNLTADDLLAAVAGCERLVSTVTAWQHELLRRLDVAMSAEVAGLPGRRGLHPAHETAEEVALALAITSRAADARLDLAQRLGSLPCCAAALEQGHLGVGHARALVDVLGQIGPPVPDPVRVELDAALTADALRLRLTPSQLRSRARRAVLAADPAGSEQRRRSAVRGREVSIRPDEHGMAWLSAYLPAPAALACREVLDTHARNGEGGDPDDLRGLGARRADALVNLILTGTPDGNPPVDAAQPAQVVVHLNVTVPVTTLAGSDDQPALLEGYGPIDATMVRELADQPGSLVHRLLTEPVAGRLVALDTSSYRPTPGLDRFVRLRDGTCRWPGCSRAADGCDLDHLVPWPQGPTNADNLHALCRRHHRLTTLGRFGLSRAEQHLRVHTALHRLYPRPPALE